MDQMGKVWKESVGLGALCLLFGVLANKGNGDERLAVALAGIGAALIGAGLLMWWVRAQVAYRRQRREERASQR